MHDPIFVHVANSLENTAEDKLHTFDFLSCIVARIRRLAIGFGILSHQLTSLFVGFVIQGRALHVLHQLVDAVLVVQGAVGLHEQGMIQFGAHLAFPRQEIELHGILLGLAFLQAEDEVGVHLSNQVHTCRIVVHQQFENEEGSTCVLIFTQDSQAHNLVHWKKPCSFLTR